MSSPSVVRGSCHHDCPDTCVWDVTVEDGRAVRLRGNADHPTTRGQLCPKVNRFLARVYHPDRITTPLRRTGPRGSRTFEPITWDEALDTIADRLTPLIERAPSSILQFSFDGTQGVLQKGIVADRFFDAIGASDIRRHLCGVTAFLGAADVVGLPLSVDPESLHRAKSIVLWGTNTMVTNRHLWPTIDEARASGAQVTVIDPVRTQTADRADRFLAIRPGTDIALALGVVQVLERDDLLDTEWLRTATSGSSELLASARGRSLTELASICGLDVGEIEGLARVIATRRPSAIRVLVGPEHRANGREAMRAIAMVAAVAGIGRDVGGGLVRSTQAYFEEALAYPEGRPARRRFNMARLGEVLTEVDDPPIEALVVHNSNPAVICPDQNRVVRGLERSDLFTVVVEQFLTDTAVRADVVLPATTQLEHDDLGIAWGHLYLTLNQKAIEPIGECRSNADIFRALGRRLGVTDRALFDSDEAVMEQLLDSGHPWLDGITLDSLRANTWERLRVPVDYRPFVDEPPTTPDGRLHLGPLDPSPPVVANDGGFVLQSRKQHPGFLNANYGPFPAHQPPEGGPRLAMHPADAAERGLDDGSIVTVANERGALTVELERTDRVGRGTVALPFGWWGEATPEGRGVNALTNPTPPDDDIGSAAFHDTIVWVDPAPTDPR